VHEEIKPIYDANVKKMDWMSTDMEIGEVAIRPHWRTGGSEIIVGCFCYDEINWGENRNDFKSIMVYNEA
jgi:hypothetical protein